jgi:hypothetical protein
MNSSMMAAHPLRQGGVVVHHRPLRDPHRGILVERLDDQRKAHVARPLRGLTARADEEMRDAQPLVGEHHLGQGLVARQHQSRGRGAGVGQTQHLQDGGHPVVQRGEVAKMLGHVEHDVHGRGPQSCHQRIEISAEAEEPDLVPQTPERPRDIELRLVAPFELARVVLLGGWIHVGIEQDEYVHGAPGRKGRTQVGTLQRLP